MFIPSGCGAGRMGVWGAFHPRRAEHWPRQRFGLGTGHATRPQPVESHLRMVIGAGASAARGNLRVAGLVEERFRWRLQRKTDINGLPLDGAGAYPVIGVVSVTGSGINGASLIAPPRRL